MTVEAHGHSHGGTDSEHESHEHHAGNLNTMALSATLHCLTGCAIGEIAGLMLGTALGLGNLATIALAVGLAFLFGYSLSTLPLLRAGVAVGTALSVCSGCGHPLHPDDGGRRQRRHGTDTRSHECGARQRRFLGEHDDCARRRLRGCLSSQPLLTRQGQGSRADPSTPRRRCTNWRASVHSIFQHRYSGGRDHRVHVGRLGGLDRRSTGSLGPRRRPRSIINGDDPSTSHPITK